MVEHSVSFATQPFIDFYKPEAETWRRKFPRKAMDMRRKQVGVIGVTGLRFHWWAKWNHLLELAFKLSKHCQNIKIQNLPINQTFLQFWNVYILHHWFVYKIKIHAEILPEQFPQNTTRLWDDSVRMPVALPKINAIYYLIVMKEWRLLCYNERTNEGTDSSLNFMYSVICINAGLMTFLITAELLFMVANNILLIQVWWLL